MPKYQTIPLEELGPNMKIDFENNTIVGESGKVYTNVEVNRKDLDKLIKELLKKQYKKKLG